MEARILNLLVGYDDGDVQPHYGIVWDGCLWLVTAWLVNRAAGIAKPERMIRVDSFDPADGRFDFANILLPRAAIEGLTQETPGFEVRSLPDSPVVDPRNLKPLPSLF